MGIILKEESIGNLSEAGGVLTLQPSLLNIGGQQYKTGVLQVTPPTPTIATFYRVYAVVSGGAPQLVVSTNNRLAGPDGYSAWKLVGHFYSGSGDLAPGIFALSKATLDGRVAMPKIRAAAHQNPATNQVYASTGSTSRLILDAQQGLDAFDPYRIFSTSNNGGFLVPRTGIYYAYGQIGCPMGGTTDRMQIVIQSLSSGTMGTNRTPGNNQGNSGINCKGVENVGEGDEIYMTFSQESGSNRTILGNDDNTYLLVEAQFDMDMDDVDL